MKVKKDERHKETKKQFQLVYKFYGKYNVDQNISDNIKRGSKFYINCFILKYINTRCYIIKL